MPLAPPTRPPAAPRSLLALLLLLTVTAAPRPARADASADEADLRFHRGTALFKAGKYEDALTEFLTSNRLVPNRNVIFNIARSYEALERYEEAYRYYVEYLAQESDPSERAAAQARVNDLTPRVALVRIESNPPGATVYLERRDLGGRGETPLLIAVPPGKQRVLVELAGYRPFAAAVDATRGRQALVQVRLEQIVGTLEVRSRPPAQVFVDRAAGAQSAPAATATPTSLKLAPGRHTVELEAVGFRSLRSDVVIHADGTTMVDTALEARPPPSGTVVLASENPGALVTVDGVESGFTPAVLTLVTGTHDIEVRQQGYRSWRRTVDVAVDGRLFYQVELEAQEAEVTGATRTQQTVSTAPASVSLVPREEIWAFGYRTLTEAVQAARGLYSSDDRNYEAIGIRGFSRPGDYTNRILLLEDGHSLNDDWIGSAAVGRDFAADLDDAQRIEVVRGPGSTFYGPGAFFGVIQVVSDPAGVGPPARAGGTLDSQGGGLMFARGNVHERWGGLSIYTSAYDSAGRTFEFRDFAGDPSRGVVRDADGENAQRVHLRGRVGELELDAGYTRRSKDEPTAYYGTVIDPAHHDATGDVRANTIDRRGYAEARYQHRQGPVSVAASLAYDGEQYDGIYPYDDDTGAYVYKDEGGGRWWTGEARTSWTGFGQTLTLGGDAARHQVQQGVDGDGDGMNDALDETHDFWNAAAYLADEAELGPRVRVSAGARLDLLYAGHSPSSPDKDPSATAVSPRLGVILTPYDGGRTKLVAGRAFRPPSIYELYYQDGGATQVAPTSLEPETVWTGEVEHTHFVGARSYLVASAFASRIDHLITLGTNADDLLVFQNTGDKVTAVGGELAARFGAAHGGAWWAAAVSYTDLGGTTDTLATVKVNSAAAVASLRGYWPVMGDRLALAGEVAFDSARPMRDEPERQSDAAPALLGRLFASGTLHGPNLSYRVGVTNLFDWDWSVPVGDEYTQRSIPQEPRTFEAELVYQTQ